MFRVNNNKTRMAWRHSSVVIFNFGHKFHLYLVILLLTLNK